MKHVFICKSKELLSQFLSDNLAGVKLDAIKSQIKQGEVKVNGKKVKENLEIFTADRIEIFLPARLEPNIDLEIVYKDDNIIVVNKPAYVDVENHLVSLLSCSGETVYPVHRLDRNTTGLVILALNEESQNILLAAMKNHTITKYYHALVVNPPPKNADTLNSYLFKDSAKSMCYVSDTFTKGYMKISTSYKVIGNSYGFTLLEVIPHTGKTHQIRVHLSHIGCSIVGDSKYGDQTKFDKSVYKYQQLQAVKVVFNGLIGKLCYLNGKEISV